MTKPAAVKGAKVPAAFTRAEAAVRAHAMAKPEATEHFPWGERAIKVRGKVFVFMYCAAEKFSMSAKLPDSHAVAVMLPFAEPTGYGLGKSGWVTAQFAPGDDVPAELLTAWVDESFVAVAPKKLTADGAPSAKPTKKLPTTASKAKPAAKKPLPPTRRAAPRASGRAPRADRAR